MWNEATHLYTKVIPCGPRMGSYKFNVKVIAYVTHPSHTFVEFETGEHEWVRSESLQKITKYKGD